MNLADSSTGLFTEQITSENERVVQNLVNFAQPFFEANLSREGLYSCIMAVIAYRFAHEMPFDRALCRYILSMDGIAEATARLIKRTKEWVLAFALAQIALTDSLDTIESDHTLCPEHKNRLTKIKKIIDSPCWSGKTSELIAPFQSDSVFVNAIFLLFSYVLNETHSHVKKRISWFLLFYSVLGKDLKILRILLENSVYSNQREKDSKNTPLHYAAELGHVDVLELLLTYNKSQLELPNKNGITPLQKAVTLGKMEIVRVLLRHGANIHTAHLSQPSALQIAERMGNAPLRALFEFYNS